jgi:outer membrane receptor protein involved in Fe transport
MEFDWTGWGDHAIQANFEVAYNSVEGSLVQTEDTGTGPTKVAVPGANTRVEELRWDVLFQDSWTRSKLVFNYGLGLERSTISSSGDDDRERSFFFLKPLAQLTYSPNVAQQLRMRVAREVSQLDFNDFISTSVFEDDDLALGNPELMPETTWVAELSHERRFGELGVVTLSAFYHWITNVQDLLPLTSEFEVPGNIGNGNRWGFELESTIPLEWLRLAGSRLDVKARWQDSSVTDPVTGEKRVLSGKAGFGASTVIPFRDDTDEFKYIYDIAYRQDFNTTKVAWGWDIAERGKRILYKVNELDVVDESELEFNAFVETTRWWDIKARIEAQNILNLDETRDRIIFIDTRNISVSDLQRREISARDKGFRLFLILSGIF